MSNMAKKIKNQLMIHEGILRCMIFIRIFKFANKVAAKQQSDKKFLISCLLALMESVRSLMMQNCITFLNGALTEVPFFRIYLHNTQFCKITLILFIR